LRSCDIKVYIEYDVLNRLERVIELINRTNQLNYTKKRLPENFGEAAEILKNELNVYGIDAGLIKVVDKYGDYGFVGFFMIENQRSNPVIGKSNTTLKHYVFSCRTLGMLIEQWVFNFLGQPELNSVGEVLTKISEDKYVDWVTLVETQDYFEAKTKRPEIAEKIVMYGGCEVHSIGLYLNGVTENLTVIGNYTSNGIFTRMNSSDILLNRSSRSNFSQEAKDLGLPVELETVDLFTIPNNGESSLFVFFLKEDAYPISMKHKDNGWKIYLEPRLLGNKINFLTNTTEEISNYINYQKDFPQEVAKHYINISTHLEKNYDLSLEQETNIDKNIIEILDKLPLNSKCIFAYHHDEYRPNFPSEETTKLPQMTSLTLRMKMLTAQYHFAEVLSFTEVILGPEDMLSGDHYSRQVYMRIAEKIEAIASQLTGKK